MNKARNELLLSLLSQPTAPYREQYVITWIKTVLEEKRIPYFTDPTGNIVVGAASANDYRKLLRKRADEPVRVFIAHMDHPGFHGMRWIKPDVLKVQWHGGSPTKHLEGAKVWLVDDMSRSGEGIMRNARLRKEGWAIDTAEIHFSRELVSPRPKANTLFGGFAFRKPVWKSGQRLYTKAADDLIGVFCIIATALEIFSKKKHQPFIGLITRAEEVGLIGAVGHFEKGWLQEARRLVVCVSLEASRTLPGAEVGKGPIVRLGDRRTPFHADSLQVLTDVADQILPKQYQRRIMDGGTCEGTVAMAYGLPTIALAVPLGNYHNQGLEGGPDCRAPHGPAPEFVHLDDIEGQRKLCLALMDEKLSWNDPWHTLRSRLKKNYREHRELLK